MGWLNHTDIKASRPDLQATPHTFDEVLSCLILNPRLSSWTGAHFVRTGLLGFAKVRFPSGMIIADVTVLTGERGFWASPPSKPQIGSDGVVIKDFKHREGPLHAAD